MSALVDVPRTSAPGRRSLRLSGLRSALPRRRAVARQASVATQCVTWTLVAIGLVAVWLLLYGLGLSSLQEQHAQANLYSSFRSQLAAATAPIGGDIPRGSPVAMLQAPRGGLHDVVVVEGSASSELRLGPGLYPGASLPGQAGASTIMGKGSSFGAPFSGISALRPGDDIQVTTGQGIFTYVVQDVRRPGNPIPQLGSAISRLTLVTSEGRGWRSGWAPTGAVFVDANLKGNTQPSPGGSTLPTKADSIMTADFTNLYPLVLWLQLTVLVGIGFAFALARWGRWQAWLVGAPAILFALWGSTSSVSMLLPNLV